MDGGDGAGSIPACAGEPCCWARWPWAGSVYPRVCGGTRRAMGLGLWAIGLSPRVRGNQRHARIVAQCKRSIPACAGEPDQGADANGAGQVYPRVCGGTASTMARRYADRGLSPRVRGNLGECNPGRADVGSIPACAGEPRARVVRYRCTKVYPRVCGGTALARYDVPDSEGLSPRVRGNLDNQRVAASGFRSIPACAGEPPSGSRCRWPPGVYPRVCGGTRPTASDFTTDAGLSPRVRGNLIILAGGIGGDRSIPACAGEPGISAKRHRPSQVYPRVCGGTRGASGCWRSSFGLSPRVRGNQGSPHP